MRTCLSIALIERIKDKLRACERREERSDERNEQRASFIRLLGGAGRNVR